MLISALLIDATPKWHQMACVFLLQQWSSCKHVCCSGDVKGALSKIQRHLTAERAILEVGFLITNGNTGCNGISS